MCGRYTLAAEPEAVAEVFGVAVPATLPKRFNIAPSQPVLAVRTQPGGEQRELVALRWGLVPSWADDPTIGNRLTNARSETVATKPAFRSSCRSRRCLIVADGFYEWQQRERGKQPYCIQLKSGKPFGFAGLWDHWDKAGEPIDSCTILTCEANALMQPIHHRMPVVIPPERFGLWLDSAVEDVGLLAHLMRPFHPDEMTAFPVSTLVNSVKNDSPACRTRAELVAVEKQTRLFS
jgi:putative SOS response-associated peptidase YedK